MIELPFGAAKSILASMVDGETKLVHPDFGPTFIRTAQAMQVGIIARPVRRGKETRIWIKRVPITSPIRTTLRKRANLEEDFKAA